MMKKYIQCVITTFLLIGSASEISAQYQNTYIYTPKNTAVAAGRFIDADYTSAQKNDAKNYWLSVYNNRITYQGEATFKYNCHAYAWHVSEGGSQVWINTPEQKKYWNDDSYIEVSNPAIATKVSFGGPCYYWDASQNRHVDECDHSAVTTSATDYFISKWGPSPLFRHHKDDCPYSIEDLHYYTRITISGPQYFCSSGTFSVTNLPNNHTVVWTVVRKFGIYSFPGATTETYTTPSITLSGSPGSPEIIEFSAAIKDQNGTIITTLPYAAMRGTFSPRINTLHWHNDHGDPGSTNGASFGNTLHLEAGDVDHINLYTTNDEIHDGTVSAYSISIDDAFAYDSNNNIEYYFSGIDSWMDITVPCNAVSETDILMIRIQNSCGVSTDYFSIPIQVHARFDACDEEEYAAAYPNPVSDILNVEIADQTKIATTAKQSKTDPAYDVRLYDGQGNLLRQKKSKGGTVQFNVAGLPNGIYYLHIYDGVSEKPEMRQIVVEH